jgi:hypothetical protein
MQKYAPPYSGGYIFRLETLKYIPQGGTVASRSLPCLIYEVFGMIELKGSLTREPNDGGKRLDLTLEPRL